MARTFACERRRLAGKVGSIFVCRAKCCNARSKRRLSRPAAPFAVAAGIFYIVVLSALFYVCRRAGLRLVHRTARGLLVP